MSEKLNISDDVRRAVEAFKKDTKDGEQFLVIGYSDKNTLTVVAQGAGFVDAAKEYMPSNECRYVLVRKDMQVEMAKTVKFAYIDWTPSDLPPLRRALLSTHKGQIKDLFGSVHATLQASDPTEVSEAIVNDKIADAAGTAIKYSEKAPSAAPAATETKKSAPATSSSSSAVPPPVFSSGPGVKLEDEKAIKDAIKSIHSDDGPTWMVVRYAGKDTLSLAGTGNGDLEECHNLLESDNVNFILARVVDIVDGKSRTLKFVYIKWQPEATPPMKKAAINTKREHIDKLFEPYHVSYQTDTKSEITQTVIVDKVGQASGTKSNVLNA